MSLLYSLPLILSSLCSKWKSMFLRHYYRCCCCCCCCSWWWWWWWWLHHYNFLFPPLEFYRMLKRPDISNTSNPRVFVFSIFEVRENVSVPETKEELLKMIDKGEAIPFHKFVCPKCHNVPMSKVSHISCFSLYLRFFFLLSSMLNSF